MYEMPVGRKAVAAGVLAHRGHDDAIGERQVTKCCAIEEMGHSPEGCYIRGSRRFSFSTRVVRFRFSNREARPLLPPVFSRARRISSCSILLTYPSKSMPSS